MSAMQSILALLMLALADAEIRSFEKSSGVASLRAAYAAQAQRSGFNTKVTPVQKVIELLQGMLEKGKKEKHEEQVQFASYKQFCDDATVEKQRSIKEAEEMIEMLRADIQQYAVDAETLGKEIAGHDEDIATWTGDIKAATKVREVEKADYDETHKDYSESVDALERAIAVLKKQAHDRKQADLVQVAALKNLNFIPKEAKRAIDIFLAQDPDESLAQVSAAAPEANAYEFQSQGIIDMLQKLLDKFIDERTTLEKEESNSRHAYELLKQDLEAQIEQATKDRDAKAETKAKKLQAKADAEGQLQDTTSTMEDDKKYLEDLTATCEQKASDFSDRQQLRAEEIEAIEKAIEIISSEAVQGNAEKHLPGLLQTKKTSFAQLRGSDHSPAQERVAEYLRQQASQLNSRVLSALAVRVEADPFKKVKKLIKDLITRLLEEANEEAEHKGWCDTELATNEQTRNEKTEAVETLHAEIDELQASIAKLTEEITELTEAVAALDAAVAKATKIREEEKAKNTETVADSQEAQTAVAQALTVLKEFYAKAAESTALLQQQPESPEIFDKPYKGMGGESGGVIGMLEVIQSDFARLEAETKAAEEQAQKEYDEFMTDSEVDKAQKTKDIEHKTKKKQDQSQTLEEKQGDLEGTQKELDAALAYYEKLKPSCVDSGVSYEDRVARRKEEIQSLQEALKILNGEDIAF
jgi:cell division septum initiation protein DivIVA